MIRALVFDFDGLILETETQIFRAWQELYERFNCQLPLDLWMGNVGTAEEEFDPAAELERQVGRALDSADIDWRWGREAELIAELSPLPGVKEYLEDAVRLGLKIGLASSSDCRWVTGHLERLDFLKYFDAIAARDDVRLTKPDPELYRKAVAWLGVAPHEALAFEDSLNGLRAAKRAGLHCVAVPNEMTRLLALDEADLLLPSLAAVPLEDLLKKFPA